MKYNIIVTKTFERDLKKLSAIEQKQVRNGLKKLQHNPQHPSLRTKKIRSLKNVFESSINMDIRIIWKYWETKIIIILDVGHHSVLDKT